MATTIGTLAVMLRANSAAFTAGMKRATGQVTTFGAASSVVKSQVRALGSALLGLAGATGFGALVAGSLRSGDALAKFSARIGASVEGLQVLRQAAQLAGVQANQLDMGLQRMTRRVAEAARGTGEAKAALLELGVSARALVSLRPEQQFAVIADALGRVGAQSDRVRLAFKLFDSEGVALVNVAAMGSQGIDALRASMERLGLIVEGPQLRAIESANDALSLLGTAFSAAGQRIAAALAPQIQGLAASLIALGQRALPVTIAAVQTLAGGVRALAPYLKVGIQLWAAYRLALLAVTAVQAAQAFVGWASALAGVAAATRGAATATWALNVAMTALNVSTGGILPLVAKLVAAAAVLAAAWFGLEKLTQSFGQSVSEVRAQMADFERQAQQASEATRDATQTLQQAAPAVDNARSAFDGLTGSLIEQLLELRAGSRAVLEYRLSLMDVTNHERGFALALYDQIEAIKARNRELDESRRAAERAAEAQQRAGEARAQRWITESMSALERLQAGLREINALEAANFLTAEQAAKARAKVNKEIEQLLEKSKTRSLAEFTAQARPRFEFGDPRGARGIERAQAELAATRLGIDQKIERNTREAAQNTRRIADQGLGLAVV